MKAALRRLSALLSRPPAFAAFLLALCLAAYGPLLAKLGFYWDDFPMAWIAATKGGAGLARYFSTNRPVWGLIYQATTPLLGSRPLAWQVFALLLRWSSGLLLWWLLRLLWPGKGGKPSPQAAFAGWAAALFVIYPGFSQQYIAFLYSHFFIVLISFLLSLCLMVLAVQRRAAGNSGRLYWPLTCLSLLLGLFNLLAMEYFFLLDLLRPLLIFIALSGALPDRRRRLVLALRLWLPFLFVFAGAMFWRSVLFGFQTYQPALMSRVRAGPLQALSQLLPTVLNDVWKTSAGAWARAFRLPGVLETGTRNLQRYWLFTITGGLAASLYLLFFRPGARQESLIESQTGDRRRVWLTEHAWAWQPVALGVLALFIAGGPFWLTDLQVGLVFPNDRFTLPFMLGASLAVAGLLALLPAPVWAKAVLLSAGLGFAVGVQFQYAIDYNRDWSVQRAMFWQMTWRMPDLAPGTALLSNELPVTHYTDNSLTAPLNWTYDPDSDPFKMQYALLYPTLRKEQMLSNFQKNRPVELNYLAATFHGNTAQMVPFYFNPPGCLRVLDPQVDLYNWMVPQYLRESLALSNMGAILPEPAGGKSAPRPPAEVYGGEIPRGWCYYFEKGDLARQEGNWQEVARLGDQGFASGEYPNDPLERFPFIEGYAHVGAWNEAVDQSRTAYGFSPTVMQPMLCKLWERIDRQTQAAPGKTEAVRAIQNEMACDFPVQ